MSVPDTDNIPDECPACGADLTVDRLTDVEEMHALRRYYTFEAHMKDQHRFVWSFANKAARITTAIRRLLRKLKP